MDYNGTQLYVAMLLHAVPFTFSPARCWRPHEAHAYCNFTSFPYRTVSAYVSPLHAVRNVGECLLIAVHYLLQLVQIISGWGQLKLSVRYLASTCPVNLCLLWPLQGFVLEDATGLMS